MTNSAPVGLAVALAVPPVLLWVLLCYLVWRVRRRVPAAAGVVMVTTGLAANAYPVASVAGAQLPSWASWPGVAIALVIGYGYMLVQLRKHRAAINGPWPEYPPTVSRRQERQRIAEHYRAVVARMDAREAGVDAPAPDETETR